MNSSRTYWNQNKTDKTKNKHLLFLTKRQTKNYCKSFLSTDPITKPVSDMSKIKKRKNKARKKDRQAKEEKIQELKRILEKNKKTREKKRRRI